MKILNTLVLGFVVMSVGCAEKEIAPQADSSKPSAESAYILAAEPADAVAVGAARETAKNDQPIAVAGRIGGSAKPFVDGIAAFTIVDLKVPYCADDEGCPTPWDYCCTQDEVKSNIATVKIVDESGKPVSSDARELLEVKELSEVVVQGTAKRDDQGNLSLAASKVYVRAGKQE
jgi:hypothetical protein